MKSQKYERQWQSKNRKISELDPKILQLAAEFQTK